MPNDCNVYSEVFLFTTGWQLRSLVQGTEDAFEQCLCFASPDICAILWYDVNHLAVARLMIEQK